MSGRRTTTVEVGQRVPWPAHDRTTHYTAIFLPNRVLHLSPQFIEVLQLRSLRDLDGRRGRRELLAALELFEDRRDDLEGHSVDSNFGSERTRRWSWRHNLRDLRLRRKNNTRVSSGGVGTLEDGEVGEPGGKRAC